MVYSESEQIWAVFRLKNSHLYADDVKNSGYWPYLPPRKSVS